MEFQFRPGLKFPYLAIGTSRIGRDERFGGYVVYYHKTREDRATFQDAERKALGLSK